MVTGRDQRTIQFNRTYWINVTLEPLVALVSIAFSEANRHTPKDIKIPGHFTHFATPVGDIDKLVTEVVSKVSEYLRTGLNVRIVYK